MFQSNSVSAVMLSVVCRDALIPGARWSEKLIFVRRRLMFVGARYITYLRPLRVSGVFEVVPQIFGKLVHS